MQKWLITSGIIVFVAVTVFVLAVDDSSQRKKVQFTNQSLVLNNENTDVKNEKVNVNLGGTKLENKDISASNKSINIKSNNTNFDNVSGNYSNQQTNYSNSDESFKSQDTKFNRQLNDYENQKSKIKSIENRFKNKSVKASSDNFEPVKRNRYIVKDIDWNTWKSNFINQIIDDSMYIKSLDNYDVGSWFYYSFNVDKYGRISDITVKSMYLSSIDKDRIRKLIKSYEYKDITVFPANTRKTTAKVDAVVMLGNSEKKARPSDFNENEQVKIQMPY